MFKQEKNVKANVAFTQEETKNQIPLQFTSAQGIGSKRKTEQLVVCSRKRYLASLREAYAQELFSKLMNELPGTLTMKNHKGTWHLVFSCGQEEGMIQAKGKILAHAIINLASKSNYFTSKITAL